MFRHLILHFEPQLGNPQKNPKCTKQLEIFFLSGHA